MNSLDNRHLIKQIGPILINSTPPSKPTRHRDMVKQVPSGVLSRPSSPSTWNFGMKDSITTAPPRPGTSWGSSLSPPQPRRAPISVDHTLRKHALDFSWTVIKYCLLCPCFMSSCANIYSDLKSSWYLQFDMCYLFWAWSPSGRNITQASKHFNGLITFYGQPQSHFQNRNMCRDGVWAVQTYYCQAKVQVKMKVKSVLSLLHYHLLQRS